MNNTTSTSHSGSSPLISFAIVLPIVIYLAYAWYFSGSLFYADDFHLLKTVQWQKNAQGLYEKITLLYHQHQEHRIIVPRLLTLLDYYIEGHINWRSLIMFSNLIWCGTIYLLWKAFLSLKISRWYFIPIPWLLLHPQYYDNVTWAISILQQSDVVFLFTLLTYLCARKKYNAALVVSILATFTHGNGIFSFPIAIVFAALEKDWKSAVKFFAVMVVVALFYFHDFRVGQNANISQSLSDPVNLIRCFGVFLGGISLMLTQNYTISAFLGLTGIGIFTAWSLITVRKKLLNENTEPPLFDKMLWGITAFLFISAILVVVTRGWRGEELIAAPRYLHYSSYVICVIYLVFQRISGPVFRKWTGFVTLPAAILFYLLSYLNFTPHIRFMRDQLLADEANYIHHDVFLQYDPAFNENIKELYAQAVASGVVKMHDKISKEISHQSQYTGAPLIITKDSLDPDGSAHSSYLKIARINGLERPGEQVFLLARTSGQKPFWIPVFTQRASYKSLLATGALRGKDFYTKLILGNLPSGIYQLGLFADGEVLWTDQYLPVTLN